MKRNILIKLVLSLCILVNGPTLISAEESTSASHSHEQSSGNSQKKFSIIGIEYQGSKVWIPGTLIVKKGDTIRILIKNNIPSDPNVHGFAIDEYGIKLNVERGKTQTIEFLADREGLFTIYCQLHPAHIGGQLLVIP